jgi:hypothetical protein
VGVGEPACFLGWEGGTDREQAELRDDDAAVMCDARMPVCAIDSLKWPLDEWQQ